MQLPFTDSVIQRDPSANKHGGNPQSVEAHSRVVHTKQERYKQILDFLASRGSTGATSKEMADIFGVALNVISGRFSELKQLNWIKENGDRREGAAVLVKR